MLRALRLWAVIGGVSIMIGEAYRSWGMGRPIAFWMDDMIMGGLLLASAWAMRMPTPRRFAWFAASWGIAAGMLYGSFFGKVFDPAHADAGNFSPSVLTILIGIAFVIATACTVLTIREAGRRR